MDNLLSQDGGEHMHTPLSPPEGGPAHNDQSQVPGVSRWDPEKSPQSHRATRVQYVLCAMWEACVKWRKRSGFCGVHTLLCAHMSSCMWQVGQPLSGDSIESLRAPVSVASNDSGFNHRSLLSLTCELLGR